MLQWLKCKLSRHRAERTLLSPVDYWLICLASPCAQDAPMSAIAMVRQTRLTTRAEQSAYCFGGTVGFVAVGFAGFAVPLPGASGGTPENVLYASRTCCVMSVAGLAMTTTPCGQGCDVSSKTL